ncbi:Retrovirus-related Pol polyprotein from transposon TNT 1-94 [Vitis vinifera]|uniref:Retrovirus-related Pol polyprotein from transposon TNT 1-94 n=1 Tax=Vitis vinifera TaxID=29760 RepID=A0A438CTU5_VITVI|nr:Retrovirus-related Pol polyprotein from transposon TNT 1-94 [Vitis vinifera]
MITSEKLVGSENNLSWSASVELWFMGQGYEDHLVTLTSSSWFLRLLASVQILRPSADQILGSCSVPSLDDVFARLLRISSTQTLPSDNTSDSSVLVSQTNSRGGRSGNRGRGQRPHCTYCNKFGHTRDRGISLTDSEYDDYLRYQATKSASVASVAQTGNASACLTHTSSLGPWILDSGASDHISGNKDLFSSITTTSALPTDRSTGKTIGIGRESQGLYHLTSPSTPAVCISTDAPLLIHSRLGHPSLSKFQKMVPRFSSLSSLACESCQLGKHTRVSFPKRLNNRAKSPFELVHTDVWGPCRTASTLGFQYFVTFIDDYSRCTCDNAREYFSAPFTSFMSQHGILHQSSCAHTPQQNGVAEPCYLINRMPSSVLHDQIPHSLLFPDQPLYFLPPRVFGCTCFVHILTPGQDKLSAKATKCIFLGYSRLQKGYRCYSSETHRYFLSADVTSLRTHHSSPPLSLFLFLKSYPFPLSPHLMQCLLAHFRFIIAVIIVVPPSLAEVPADSLPIPSASPAPALPPSADLPIALRKGNRSTRNPHPIYNFLSYHRLSSPYSAFVSAISSVSLPKSTPEALSHPGWRQAMVDEMLLYTPMALGILLFYPLVYGSDYGDTFSPVAKIASVRLLLSMAAMRSWPLYQLDIKNAFLHGDLAEEVYMEQPPGFVAQGSLCIYLVVYVDDIVITGSDQNGIQKLKQHLFTHFQTKDLGKLKYFLGIEIAQSSSVWFFPKGREPLGDPGRYRRLVGKLNYLTITRPDISFPVSVVSQFLQSPCDSHWDAVIRILRYIKSTPGQGVLYENRGHTQVVGYTDADWAGSPTDRRSTSGYCVFIGGNLISWKSKKQDVVARSSAEAEYRAMALATCELIWLKHLLRELRFGKDEQMKLICDNQAALHIASNPVFMKGQTH